MPEEMNKSKEYNAESIKVLEGLEAVRKQFDVIEIIKPFIPQSILYKIGGINYE